VSTEVHAVAFGAIGIQLDLTFVARECNNLRGNRPNQPPRLANHFFLLPFYFFLAPGPRLVGTWTFG
jgi:hypothetical protein